jgi:2-polyprenyl-3-methyl-5-hydroxy-6-metoxy-1,4-benzoquinol methylase
MNTVNSQEVQTVTRLDLRHESGKGQSMSTAEGCNLHYDDSYFAWQSSCGQLIANLERWKFTPFVKPADVVLDFGCGGGYILAGLACRERYGVEINPVARLEAARVLKVQAAVDDLPADVAFDVIISHHALEHVDNPLRELERLKSRLTPEGKMVFVVPSELWPKQRVYRPGDINQHLYTWTPLSLGNLFARAGLVVERTELLMHRTLPKTSTLYPFMAESVFHFCCRIWAGVTLTRQIRIVASRPAGATS